MSTKIDISGLDKVELLHELWENTRPAAFFHHVEHMAPHYDAELAADAVRQHIDYFCGRCIKTDLTQDTVNPYLYDRDAGAGAFARIVTKMKETLPHSK